MDHHDRQQKDLVLNSNEFAFVLDKTKGNISTWTGPVKTSLSATDSPVIFNEQTKRFEERRLEEAIQSLIIAPEGWYIVLKNPDKNGGHPVDGKSSETPKLDVGRKVNINGPVSFPLYPGQMAKVIRGHHLRSNQYLLVRVYDEAAARSNWETAVIKKVETSSLQSDGKTEVDTAPISPSTTIETLETTETKSIDEIQVDELTVGKVMVIKGTEVSFYIPPTGIEVLGVGYNKTSANPYVREAVTLERLEYCILKDESGTKRYVRGPAVVFPEPTETFILDKDSPKFRAIELSEISGIYIKVIADYSEDGKSYKAGDELFITGKEQMIYFPRSEHAFIKYGDNIIHHAIAIPKGNGRYVLDRLSGNVKTIRGPMMYLADPRKEVLVQRKLTATQAEMWYPGNVKVKEYNIGLSEDGMDPLSRMISSDYLASLSALSDVQFSATNMTTSTNIGENVTDNFNRKQTFTKPRTITLDDNNKFEGVVQIGVWTGYAINVVSKDGSRKVVEGPCTYNMEYDESLEVLEFSTGKPKSTDRLERGVYLRVKNNKISDIIRVETKDFVPVELYVSYNVNFVEDSDKWFAVENYVKFLCDNMRSHLKRVAKEYNIEEFYADSSGIVRDTVLGPIIDPAIGVGSMPPHTKRSRLFEENGMLIKDVELLGTTIKDPNIREMLSSSQETDIANRITLESARKKDEAEAKLTEYAKAKQERDQEAILLKIESTKEVNEKEYELKVQNSANLSDLKMKSLKADKDSQVVEDEIAKAALARAQATIDQKLAEAQKSAEIGRYRTETQSKAIKSVLEGISPELSASIKYASDIEGIGHIAQQLSPLTLVNGSSIADTANKLLAGTALEGVVRKLIQPAENGTLDNDYNE